MGTTAKRPPRILAPSLAPITPRNCVPHLRDGDDEEDEEEYDDESDSVAVSVRASAYVFGAPMEEVCMLSEQCVIMVNGVCV